MGIQEGSEAFNALLNAVMDANPQIYGNSQGGWREEVGGTGRENAVLYDNEQIILPNVQSLQISRQNSGNVPPVQGGGQDYNDRISDEGRTEYHKEPSQARDDRDGSRDSDLTNDRLPVDDNKIHSYLTQKAKYELNTATVGRRQKILDDMTREIQARETLIGGINAYRYPTDIDAERQRIDALRNDAQALQEDLAAAQREQKESLEKLEELQQGLNDDERNAANEREKSDDDLTERDEKYRAQDGEQ